MRKLRQLKARLQSSKVAEVFEKGKLQGEAIKAYRKVKPILKHAETCPQCQTVFKRIHDCPKILALPDGSFKEANEHILLHLPCREALKEILECPNYAKR